MSVLALTTASSFTAIALLERLPFGTAGAKSTAEERWEGKNNEAETLLPKIQELLASQGKDFSDITEVFVVRGPGSFTGLRVGVTVANTLAHLNKATLSSQTTFEFWHAASDLPILVYSGKGGVYFSAHKDAKVEPLSLDELNSFLEEQGVAEVTGDITDEQKAILKNIKFVPVTKTFGEIVQDILSTSLEKVELVAPLYIKDPGITKGKDRLFI